jgi:hypothetical protein
VESPAQAGSLSRPAHAAQHSSADDDPKPTADGRLLWGEPLRRLLGVALGLLVLTAVIVTPTALRVKGISLFDESTHADYAYEIAHGHIPAAGSVIATPIRAEIACRGPASRKVDSLPLCNKPILPVHHRNAFNQNYNWGHPPLYYAITGPVARGLGLVFRGPNFIALARMVGIGWLFAGLLVMYLALRRFRVSWPVAACGAALLGLTPAVFYLDATVTNDAAGALAGALAVLTLARVTVSAQFGWKLPGLLAALAAATKILNALPFLLVAVLLAALALHEYSIDRAHARELFRVAAAIVVGFAVVYFGWTLFQHFRGDPNWVNPITGISAQPVHGAPFDELFSTSFSGSNLLSYGYLPPQLDNAWMSALVRLWGPVAIAATGALLAVHRAWTPRFMVAAGAVLGVLSYPLVVEAQIYITTGRYFPGVVPRYGMAILPFLMATTALAVDDRRLFKPLAAFTAACVGIALFTVF